MGCLLTLTCMKRNGASWLSLFPSSSCAQAHYDWGLRAIKSVLVVAGAFKRAEPTLPEQALLMRALRDFNTPKIVQQDEVVFFGLLRDLFPDFNPPRKKRCVTSVQCGLFAWWCEVLSGTQCAFC